MKCRPFSTFTRATEELDRGHWSLHHQPLSYRRCLSSGSCFAEISLPRISMPPHQASSPSSPHGQQQHRVHPSYKPAASTRGLPRHAEAPRSSPRPSQSLGRDRHPHRLFNGVPQSERGPCSPPVRFTDHLLDSNLSIASSPPPPAIESTNTLLQSGNTVLHRTTTLNLQTQTNMSVPGVKINGTSPPLYPESPSSLLLPPSFKDHRS